ncbi:MAG: CcmD family protein [Ferruginibacter sp.]
MIKMMKILLLMVCSFCLNAVAFAQDKTSVDEVMRSNGKIYVVVTCCIIILVGLFLYVFSVDRKISKIEKHN